MQAGRSAVWGNCNSPGLSSVRVLDWSQCLEGLLPSFHPVCSLPSWAQPIAFPKLKNFRIGKTSRIFSVIAHSEGEEAQKLEDLESSEAILIRGERILGDLTIAEQT